MIVKEHEKKARGFISVTRVTARAHVSALPSTYLGVPVLTRARMTGCQPAPSRVPAGRGGAGG
jgi:hypothetical protein